MSDFKPKMQKRIVRYFVGFSLFLGVLYSLLLIAYAWLIEDNVFNQLVNEEATYIESIYNSTGEIAPPRLPFVTLYDSWEDLPGDIYAMHLSKPERIEFPTPNGETLHVKWLKLAEKELVISANVSHFEVTQSYLPYISIYLFIIVVVIMILAAFVASYVAKRSTRQLTRLTTLVAKDEIGTSQRKVSDTFDKDEFGFLAKTIEDSLRRAHLLLQREVDFTRDVSHELRTPVAVLKNFISTHVAHDSISQRDFEHLQSNISAMEQTINSLLALAREESLTKQNLKLLGFLEAFLVNHTLLNQQDDFYLDIDIPNDFVVSANPTLLQLVFDNLLCNALTHSSDKHMRITAKNNSLMFENGLQGEVPKDVFESLSKSNNSGGLGQGLNLVKRICQLMQWHVTSHSSSGKFCILIRFQ